MKSQLQRNASSRILTVRGESAIIIFKVRTSSIFDGMRSRARKLGREVPFDRAAFREWVAEQFGAPDRALQCGYCSAWLNAATFVVDHQTPGIHFPAAESPVEAMIDQATGVNEDVAGAYVEWFNKNVWGSHA